MANVLQSLPLPTASEYPYNLQGDQTKARALAAAAQAGDAGALESLRSLGLDQSGNMLSVQQPGASNPWINPGGAQQVQHEESVRRFDATHSLNEQKLASSRSQFQTQADLAQARLQQQADQFKAKQELDKQRLKQAGGGGGAKPPAPKSPSAAPSGGGGGGGKKEPTASEIARQLDRNNRANDSAAKKATARERDAQARARGFKDDRDRSDRLSKDAFFDKNRDKRKKAEQDRVDDWNKEVEERKKREAERDAERKKDPTKDPARNPMHPESEAGFGPQSPKMVHAYGNRHAGMTKARGDMA